MRIENGTGGSRETSTGKPERVGERGREPINFFAELKRRNVYKVAAAYAVVGWLLIQAASIILPTFEAPGWTLKLLIAALAIGLPIAAILAWAFELTPEGLVRSDEVSPDKSITRRTGRKLDFLIIGVLMVVISLLVTDRFRRRPASVSTTGKSIAVLPFENLSRDPDNAFFADGIQDDILTSLAKIADLKVISRTSVMQYRGAGTRRNLSEIAKALGVQNILEGSVRRDGNRVLVSAQLIDARDGRHIWAERYDRTIADSIGLQGELATEIASALRAKLAPEEKALLEAKPTKNPEAYVLYLKAREHEAVLYPRDEEIIADQLYAQAIALDPAFALAYARASILNSRIYLNGSDQARKARAQALAEQALRLSPALGEAHLALGLCFHRIDKNSEAALKELSIAAATLPNNPEILDFSAGIFWHKGRWREALANFQRAQDLDPRNANLHIGVVYFQLRDWSAAAAAFQRVHQIVPENEVLVVAAQIMLAYTELLRTGDVAVGKEILRKIPAGLDPDAAVTHAKWLFNMLERDFVEADKILAEFPSDEFRGDPKSVYQAYTALARGDRARAQGLFEKAIPIFELRVADHPGDAEFLAPLGKLYAYLGRKEDAIRTSRQAVELVPESKDAVAGLNYANDLAIVYARTGDSDRAIALIERLLSTPAGVAFAELRLSWEWDPLRSDPRFQKILEGPEPKTIYN